MNTRNTRTETLLRYGAYSIALLLVLTSALFSDLALKRSLFRFETQFFEPLELPNAEPLTYASLNYRTFAADLAWIASVVDYGESTRTDRVSEHFIENGFVITEVDPRFRRPYDWFPNVAITRLAVPSEEELSNINALIERGMEQFPNEGSLPFSAAMNYVGYSSHISEERRIRETDRAIEFLESAIQREGTPPSAPFVLQWFKNRKARLIGDDKENPEEEAQLLARMLLSVEDEQVRSRIRKRLEGLEATTETAKQSVRYENQLEAAREASTLAFLPTDLWIVTELP